MVAIVQIFNNRANLIARALGRSLRRPRRKESLNAGACAERRPQLLAAMATCLEYETLALETGIVVIDERYAKARELVNKYGGQW